MRRVCLNFRHTGLYLPHCFQVAKHDNLGIGFENCRTDYGNGLHLCDEVQGELVALTIQ